MARFRYRMQNILDIKEKMETQAKNEFAQAQAKLNAEEEKLADRVSYRQKLQEDGGRLLLADRLDILKIDENKKNGFLCRGAGACADDTGQNGAEKAG